MAFQAPPGGLFMPGLIHNDHRAEFVRTCAHLMEEVKLLHIPWSYTDPESGITIILGKELNGVQYGFKRPLDSENYKKMWQNKVADFYPTLTNYENWAKTKFGNPEDAAEKIYKMREKAKTAQSYVMLYHDIWTVLLQIHVLDKTKFEVFSYSLPARMWENNDINLLVHDLPDFLMEVWQKTETDREETSIKTMDFLKLLQIFQLDNKLFAGSNAFREIFPQEETVRVQSSFVDKCFI